MKKLVEVRCENLMELDLDTIRQALFLILEVHDDKPTVDKDEYARLLGEYAALYQYASELYTHCISLARRHSDRKDIPNRMRAMDRRDLLEQYLKAVKLNYESLSRKATVWSMEGV